MHKITDEGGGLVRLEASGKLTQEDYDELIPSWEAAIARYGKIRMLFIMRDFHGWDAHAAWDDLRFGLKHEPQVESIAMVGEKDWQQWMTKIAAWFVHADVRYFDSAQLAEAERWIRES